jgi:hypothetical protein
MFKCRTARRQKKRRERKKGVRKTPFFRRIVDQLFDNGVDRAAVNAGAAFGALVINGVAVTRLNDCAQRAGIDAGAASDAFFVNFKCHW